MKQKNASGGIGKIKSIMNNEKFQALFLGRTSMNRYLSRRIGIIIPLICTVLMSAVVMSSTICYSQQTVKEPSTGKSFPASVQMNHSGKEYTLKCTGLAVRKKFIFKVYGIAHYMQDPVNVKEEKTAFRDILTEGKAKEIIMEFARDVDAEKIRDAYLDGFKEHTTSTEFQQIQTTVNQFLGYFSKEAKENDRSVLRWLPGGIVTAAIQGEEKPAITNGLFARTLWSIWFGDDSIVDKKKLVEFMLVK
jgi:hypothetical protein